MELDAVVSGIPPCIAQSLEQIGVEVADAGIFVIEHRHAVWKGSVLLGDATIIDLVRRLGVIGGTDIAERGRR